MEFKQLSESDKDLIVRVYNKTNNRDEAQRIIAEKYGIAKRTVRKWAKKIGVGTIKANVLPSKILIYDIETSRTTFKTFWTGRQYVGHKQVIKEPKIISIAWKWLGSGIVEYLTWDKNHSDKEMIREFLEHYNKADMLIGQNNDNFDNRWVQARAMKYDFEVNTYQRSFDIMKQAKKVFRLLSYSMDYMTKFAGLTFKQSHEGIFMWDMIEDGNKEEQKEYLQKMVNYNIGDIVSTEDMYLRFRKYFGHIVHFGVLHGSEKWTCPNCGGDNVGIYKTTVTPAGTVHRIMKCSCDVKFKISNKVYMNFLDNNIKNI